MEGPSLLGNDRDKEREKREKNYEISQIQRERESNKVYQPTPRNVEREKPKHFTSTERATFKTHMAQKHAQERERKNSVSSSTTPKFSDRNDEPDHMLDDLPSPMIPAPVLAPPSLKSPASACLTYNRVPWKLRVRKEVFRPNEQIGPPAALDLLFSQISQDVLGATSCLRISPKEKRAALNLLGGHGVTLDNMRGQVRAIVKRHLVDMARGWPLYFARLFVVSGSPQLPEIAILAVSHSGVFLARKEQDFVTVQKALSFADLTNATTLPRPAALQLTLRNGNRFALHAPRAQAIQSMIQSFLQEYRQVSYVLFIFYSSIIYDLYILFIFINLNKRMSKHLFNHVRRPNGINLNANEMHFLATNKCLCILTNCVI